MIYLENLKEVNVIDQTVTSITFRPRERKLVTLRDEKVKLKTNP